MKKKWFYKKTVIISGASSGFGLLLATSLVKDFDCKVIGIARRISNLEDLKKTLGDNFSYYAFDVSAESNWIRLKDLLIEQNITPDILINNAGILPKFTTFEKCEQGLAEKVLGVNFLSCTYSAKHLLPLIKKSQTPCVINVSSSACLSSVIGTSLYSASKSALKSFTEILALENKSVYVALVCPGFAKTDIFRSQQTCERDSKLFNLVCAKPEKTVNKMLKLIGRKKRKMVIGFDAKLMHVFGKIMPNTTNKLTAFILKKAKLELFSEVFE